MSKLLYRLIGMVHCAWCSAQESLSQGLQRESVQLSRWYARIIHDHFTFEQRVILSKRAARRSRRVDRISRHAYCARKNWSPSPLLFAAVSLVVAVVGIVNVVYTLSYAVSVDGQRLGVVETEEAFQQVVSTVEDQATDILGYDYTINSDVTYERALIKQGAFTDEAVFENYLFDQIGEVMKTYLLTVDGQFIGAYNDYDALEQLLESIKAQYMTDNTGTAAFVEGVEITYGYAPSNVLQGLDEIHAALTANTAGETTYTVVSGDTYSGIAYANDMSLTELMTLNPNASLDRLMPGDMLTIKVAIPYLSVRTTESISYTESIACPVEEVQDSSMYTGTSKITTQGVAGEQVIDADVIFINGIEQERTITNTTVTREPTTTVKAVGTKERPKTMPTGSFSWPCAGHISSYFGYRTLRGCRDYHSGVDIAGSYGTSIYAADGGTVTFSGYKSGYGYVVIISHGSGVQSYYGHCSSLLVSAGTAVYKGQLIARMGSTGNSTGNHCHFEIRLNGTAVNPLSYLP